jgi:hypothetical protein
MIPTSNQWDAISQTPGQPILVARLYYGDGTKYISVSNDDVQIDGERFIGFVSGIPNITQAIDIDTHNPTVSKMTMEIDNLLFQPGKRFSDYIETIGAGADLGFENRRADVRIYLDGITSFDNCFKILENGIIRDLPHDWESAQVIIEDGLELVMRELDDLVLDADSPTGLLPDGSNGMLGPIIMGNHQLELGSTDPALIKFKRTHNFTPAIYLGLNDSGDHEWFLADHQMDAQADLYGFDTKINRMVRLTAFNVILNTSAGSIISHADGVDFYDYFYPNGTTTQTFTQGTPTVTNRDRAANTIVDDYAQITCYDSVGASGTEDEYAFDVNFGAWDNTDVLDADISEIKNYSLTDYTESPYSGTQIFDIITSINIKGQTAAAYYLFSMSALTTQTQIASDVNIHCAASYGAPIEEANVFKIYQIFKRIKYKPIEPRLALFSGGKGYEYGTWINGRSTAEGFTETHADDDDANELIENYAGVIEGILRNQLSRVDANIDRDSFNIASNDVSGLLCSSALTATENSREWIRQHLADCKSFMWWNNDGTFKMQTIVDTYSASDRVINFDDVQDLKFDRTDANQLRTNVIVKYAWDGSVFQAKTDAAQDTTAQTRYNVTAEETTLIHESKTIRDETTANALRDFLLAFWKQPHNIALGTLDKSYLALDLGDVIEFENMPYKVRGEDITANATRAGQTIYKYWWIMKVERGELLEFAAIQLHDLS